ncbi:MAG: PqqD family protein [Pseudomonadota bacterium]
MQTQGKPRIRDGVRQFAVSDELIVVAPKKHDSSGVDGEENQALAVNQTGRIIWDLCDGQNNVADIVAILGQEFDIELELLKREVSKALISFSRQGLLDGVTEHERAKTGATFVIGVEDTDYFRWQTAIFLESFIGKLPAGWKTHVVVCNDEAPLSEELRNILESYDTLYTLTRNHRRGERIDIGDGHGTHYSALNKVEALARAGEMALDDDTICVFDSDMFLYGNIPFDLFPKGCALPRNWHVSTNPFFSSVDVNKGNGVDLDKLLEAIGCEKPLKPGAVNLFVTGAVAKDKKFVADCFRFAHAAFLLGRAAGAELTWISEMPCYALAMTANGIDYDLLEDKQFLVSDCDEVEIPDGTFYHYYSDPKDFGRAAFRDSKWHKQAYHERDLLQTAFEEFAASATTDHEKYFFQLAERARSRLNV